MEIPPEVSFADIPVEIFAKIVANCCEDDPLDWFQSTDNVPHFRRLCHPCLVTIPQVCKRWNEVFKAVRSWKDFKEPPKFTVAVLQIPSLLIPRDSNDRFVLGDEIQKFDKALRSSDGGDIYVKFSWPYESYGVVADGDGDKRLFLYGMDRILPYAKQLRGLWVSISLWGMEQSLAMIYHTMHLLSKLGPCPRLSVLNLDWVHDVQYDPTYSKPNSLRFYPIPLSFPVQLLSAPSLTKLDLKGLSLWNTFVIPETVEDLSLKIKNLPSEGLENIFSLCKGRLESLWIGFVLGGILTESTSSIPDAPNQFEQPLPLAPVVLPKLRFLEIAGEVVTKSALHFLASIEAPAIELFSVNSVAPEPETMSSFKHAPTTTEDLVDFIATLPRVFLSSLRKLIIHDTSQRTMAVIQYLNPPSVMELLELNFDFSYFQTEAEKISHCRVEIPNLGLEVEELKLSGLPWMATVFFFLMTGIQARKHIWITLDKTWLSEAELDEDHLSGLKIIPVPTQADNIFLTNFEQKDLRMFMSKMIIHPGQESHFALSWTGENYIVLQSFQGGYYAHRMAQRNSGRESTRGSFISKISQNMADSNPPEEWQRQFEEYKRLRQDTEQTGLSDAPVEGLEALSLESLDLSTQLEG